MKKADIRGKWALVTGASRGIGRQVCMGLSQYGCNLVLHSRYIAHTKSLAAVMTPFRKSFELNVTYNIHLVSSSEETKNN
jgi:short-subunit dehydrogenase